MRFFTYFCAHFFILFLTSFAADTQEQERLLQERLAVVQSLPPIVTLEGFDETFKPQKDGKFTPPSLVDYAMRSFLHELQSQRSVVGAVTVMQGLANVPKDMACFKQYEGVLARTVNRFNIGCRTLEDVRANIPVLCDSHLTNMLWQTHFNRLPPDEERSPEIWNPNNPLEFALSHFAAEQRHREGSFRAPPRGRMDADTALCSMDELQQAAHVASFLLERKKRMLAGGQEHPLHVGRLLTLSRAIESGNSSLVKILFALRFPTEKLNVGFLHQLADEKKLFLQREEEQIAEAYSLLIQRKEVIGAGEAQCQDPPEHMQKFIRAIANGESARVRAATRETSIESIIQNVDAARQAEVDCIENLLEIKKRFLQTDKEQAARWAKTIADNLPLFARDQQFLDAIAAGNEAWHPY